MKTWISLIPVDDYMFMDNQSHSWVISVFPPRWFKELGSDLGPSKYWQDLAD